MWLLSGITPLPCVLVTRANPIFINFSTSSRANLHPLPTHSNFLFEPLIIVSILSIDDVSPSFNSMEGIFICSRLFGLFITFL